jgi:sortase A
MRRALGTLLVVAGVLVLADVAVTLAWQEPLSAVRAARAQERLAGELKRLELAAPRERGAAGTPGAARPRAGTRGGGRPLGSAHLEAAARDLARQSADGDALAELRIPRLGLRTVVVRGTAPEDLRSGPGLLAGTPLPGEHGTTAIAGHRTTHGAPFRDLDDLRRGDAITLRLPYGTFRYAVAARRIVGPRDLSVLRRVGHDSLVLSACHPLFSAARRIVVLARLAQVGQSARALNRGV